MSTDTEVGQQSWAPVVALALSIGGLVVAFLSTGPGFAAAAGLAVGGIVVALAARGREGTSPQTWPAVGFGVAALVLSVAFVGV